MEESFYEEKISIGYGRHHGSNVPERMWWKHDIGNNGGLRTDIRGDNSRRSGGRKWR